MTVKEAINLAIESLTFSIENRIDCDLETALVNDRGSEAAEIREEISELKEARRKLKTLTK
jgi:hypothetical protein